MPSACGNRGGREYVFGPTHEEVITDLARNERAMEVERLTALRLAERRKSERLATLLAGLTAATGPLMGEGPPAWRWTCAIVAVVTAGAALTTGVLQRYKVPEALARALACAARLRSLDLALQLARLEPDEVGQAYEQLLATYPEELI